MARNARNPKRLHTLRATFILNVAKGKPDTWGILFTLQLFSWWTRNCHDAYVTSSALNVLITVPPRSIRFKWMNCETHLSISFYSIINLNMAGGSVAFNFTPDTRTLINFLLKYYFIIGYRSSYSLCRTNRHFVVRGICFHANLMASRTSGCTLCSFYYNLSVFLKRSFLIEVQ